MKKIVAFGDSFVHYEWVNVADKTWVCQLGKLLGLPVKNYGISGSGIGYAMDAFIKYYQSTEYSEDDIIIFVPSSEQRIYTKSMYNPRLGVVHTFQKDAIRKPQIEKDWHKVNGESALWTVFNLYDPKINYELIKTLSFFQSWAEKHITNTVIIVRAFATLDGNEHAEELVKLIKPTTNFFPILQTSTSLGAIAIGEYASNQLSNQHQAFCNGIDYRVNHLSPYHRQHLAAMLANVISTNSMDSVNFSWVQTNFVTDVSQFESLPKDYH